MGNHELVKKIFILGGSYLQLDIILEAKKMFFYVFVLDMDKKCIGKKYCDDFLQIDIKDKNLILQKSKEYKIDMILTSATEYGNISACYVAQELGLNTNSYQTALNTTDKSLMKEVLIKSNIKTPKYKVFGQGGSLEYHAFPCIVKPSDSSSAKGLSYCTCEKDFKNALVKAKKYSNNNKIIVEEYIKGKQYSVECISSNAQHQILAINKEEIRSEPSITEVGHELPAKISNKLEKELNKISFDILKCFDIKYGASHLEFRVNELDEIYIIELATRTGGWRSEMINLAFGISYSQLLLLSYLDSLPTFAPAFKRNIKCNFLLDYKAYEKYLEYKENDNYLVFEPFALPDIDKDFIAYHLGESKGYYYLMENAK